MFNNSRKPTAIVLTQHSEFEEAQRIVMLLNRQPPTYKFLIHRYTIDTRLDSSVSWIGTLPNYVRTNPLCKRFSIHGILFNWLPSSQVKDDCTATGATVTLPGLATDDNPYAYRVPHENLRGAFGFDLLCSRQTGGFLRFLSHIESSVSFSAIQPGCRFLLSSTTILRRGQAKKFLCSIVQLEVLEIQAGLFCHLYRHGAQHLPTVGEDQYARQLITLDISTPHSSHWRVQ